MACQEVRMTLLPNGRPTSCWRRPIVSVIIPTFDRPQLLDAAIGSVAKQDMVGDVEAIVVNDGGVSVGPGVRAWEEILPLKLVELVELDRRSGTAAARNVGVERADGKYIAFLDDDELFMPCTWPSPDHPIPSLRSTLSTTKLCTWRPCQLPDRGPNEGPSGLAGDARRRNG